MWKKIGAARIKAEFVWTGELARAHELQLMPVASFKERVDWFSTGGTAVRPQDIDCMCEALYSRG